jgi:hypothetical protein
MTESHYRRLLRLYPAPYQREYADEMIAVLMADRRPGFGATVDLVRSALVVRFRGGVRALREPAWQEAAAAVQLFGAIMLLAIALRRVLMVVVPALFRPEIGIPPLAADAWIRSGIWLAVVVCALLRARALGLVLATVGLGVEIAAPFREYAQTPARVLDVFGIIVATALVALTFLVVGRAAGFRLRAPRGWVPAALAGAVVALDGCAFLFPGPRWVTLVLGGHVLTVLSPVLFGSAALLLLVVAWRLEPAVRRRVIACAVPVLVTVPSVSLGFGGFREYNMGHPDELHMLSPVQWLILLAIPVAAFAVAVELNRRLEETRFGRGPRGEVGAHE